MDLMGIRIHATELAVQMGGTSCPKEIIARAEKIEAFWLQKADTPAKPASRKAGPRKK